MTTTILRPIFIIALAALTRPALAQALPQKEADVLSVVTTLFDGMKAKDTTKMRSTLAPSVRLMSAATDRSGAPTVTETAINAWISSIGRATGAIEEKIFAPEVRIDGNLATVWTRYEFWNNGARSHCGVDAFQLALTTGGWKIIHIADSRRNNCG